MQVAKHFYAQEFPCFILSAYSRYIISLLEFVKRTVVFSNCIQNSSGYKFHKIQDEF